MKSTRTATRVVITLPSNFSDELDREMNEEIRIASRKWSVKTTPEQRNRIKEVTLAQLNGKAEAVFRSPLRLDIDQAVVVVSSAEDRELRLVVGQAYDDSELSPIVKVHSNYAESTEPTDGQFGYGDLPGIVENLLRTWVRTGIFYAIGSMSEPVK